MLLLLWSCSKPSTHLEQAPPRCGDGVVDSDEACDDGDTNADAPDACRLDCSLPSCGDGVVDGGEGCDDGALIGGDGCDGACAVETGTPEVEPNDHADEATPGVGLLHGSLPEDDRDCWSFAVDRCGAVTVDEVAPCTTSLTMSLTSPDGALLAAGAPGEDGCAHLDPGDQPGARWVVAGTWTMCVTPVAGEVPSYALQLSAGASTGLSTGADLDDDGEADSCDLDRDGDSVEDATDDCVEVSNGPGTALALGPDGYVRTWLGAGPFTGDDTTGDCRPSEVARVGEDTGAEPSVGEAAGELTWRPHLLLSDYLDLYDAYGTVDAPREAYTAVWLRSETARTATLSVGADDGVFAWWNGTQVLDVSSCQGLNWDQFQASVDVIAGWNLLLLKIRDQGGGWSVAARLLDADGAAITDLTPALDPDGAWVPDQTDTDGDGIGDVCDE